MKNSSKKLSQIKINDFVATLNFYVQVLFNEPSKHLQPIKVKSRYNNK